MFARAVQHHRAGRLADAEVLYRQILKVDPRNADSMQLLGVLAHQGGHYERAVGLIRRAIAIQSQKPEFHYNLGKAFAASGLSVEAAGCFRRAIQLKPDYVAAHGNLGAILTTLGQAEDGIACFRRVVDLRPGDGSGHYNLGNALARRWRVGEAIDCLRHSVELRPDADAYNTLGNLLRDVGRAEESSAEYDKALRISPGDFAIRSNRLLVENYLPDRLPDGIVDLARSYGALASSRAIRPFKEWLVKSGCGPTRVGLVSHDLHNHPVGYFLEGLLSKADANEVVFLAFPTQGYEDELTARIKSRLAAWKPITAMSDESAARLIHSQGVHVLLDLSGHTAGNRLPMFAWRPAPVQATWLGYFSTTGLREIDCIVADRNVLPPGLPNSFTERPVLLPEIYYCFAPPAVAVEASPLPARANGFPTFGCFNNLAKINDRVVTVWARVLDAVPGSRLMLKAAPLQDEGVCSAIRGRFGTHGISAECLILEPASSREDYLRAYHRIDIALDPFPFPGGATTFEALWMGVPVLTRKGDRFLSRVGETIMRNAGLLDWLAADDDDTVSKAIHLASDLERIARLRRNLRAQVLASPLFDSERFARHFEAAIASMWADRQTA